MLHFCCSFVVVVALVSQMILAPKKSVKIQFKLQLFALTSLSPDINHVICSYCM